MYLSQCSVFREVIQQESSIPWIFDCPGIQQYLLKHIIHRKDVGNLAKLQSSNKPVEVQILLKVNNSIKPNNSKPICKSTVLAVADPSDIICWNQKSQLLTSKLLNCSSHKRQKDVVFYTLPSVHLPPPLSPPR